MKILDTIDVLKELCKAKQCYGIYFDFKGSENTYGKQGDFNGFYDELRKAIPIMYSKCEEKHLKDEFTQAFVDSEGWLIFEGEDQETVMWFNYDQISGGDPTRLNDYDGSINVYAICIGPDGQGIKENT